MKRTIVGMQWSARAREPAVPRIRLGVLADDLTGAHATAAQLVAQGRSASVVWSPHQAPTARDDLVADMRTRDRSERPGELAELWARTVADVGCTRVELRVDTTLRGAAAEELAGVVRGLRWADPLVLAVPAYPQAGRTTVEAEQRIDDASGRRRIRDAPQRLFGDAEWRPVPIDVVEQGPDVVRQHVLRAFREGVHRVLFDATSDAHLKVSAAAAESLHRDVPRLVTMSSGAWLRHYPAGAPDGFVVAVVASPTDANAAQLARLRADAGTVVVPAGCADVDLALAGAPTVVVVDTTSGPPTSSDPAAAAAETARAIAVSGAGQGLRCLGFVVTGGDAAAHLVDSLGADCLRAVREVWPLCPQGQLVGGDWSSLPIITKGGVIGEPDTLRMLVAEISTTQRLRADAPSSAKSPAKGSHA